MSNRITNIGNYAFYNCGNIEDLTVEHKTRIVVNNYAFAKDSNDHRHTNGTLILKNAEILSFAFNNQSFKNQSFKNITLIDPIKLHVNALANIKFINFTITASDHNDVVVEYEENESIFIKKVFGIGININVKRINK